MPAPQLTALHPHPVWRREAPPDASEIAIAIVIADIVHELRRAAVKPIYRVHYGSMAAVHAAGIAFGWLTPLSVISTRKAAPAMVATPLLTLTDSGRQALADAGRI